MDTSDTKAVYTAARTREVILDAIARLLPFEPRDFTVNVDAVPCVEKPGLYTTSVEVKPVSEMGVAIYPVLLKRLPEEVTKAMKPVRDEHEESEEQVEDRT